MAHESFVKPQFHYQLCSVLHLSRHQYRALLCAAGLATIADKRFRLVTPQASDFLVQRLGAYAYRLHRGKPYERPCRTQQDIAEYFGLPYKSFVRRVREFGLEAYLPQTIGRTILLPEEVEAVVKTLAGGILGGKGVAR